ncbi:DUF3368 domain-containing protein [Spirulina sp. 06S082]|uniref:DUF3368 domain-containing protein n=1 Tax=Spirulina sp. 06S082 TaxID=3110248 RepID=UPI002B21F44B|nr:DUF3368 domain-containing protein [Spirulina sp. 06S082]MEA5468181.1 DUF3368 domain-containing protein [Spirulina sp. 06S082]
MIVVSNTSPITNLAAIGKLEILEQLYGTIIIPQAVYQELTDGGDLIPGSREVKTVKWIQIEHISNPEQVILLQERLDRGESEAIALAIELTADLLLLDEQLGRQVASEYSLVFTGILGVAIEAKHKGLISAVKPLLDDLINIAEFWINSQLYSRVLNIVGES